MSLQLGKLPPRYDRRTPFLRRFMRRRGLPALVASTDWRSKVTQPWHMDGNDLWSVCGCAGLAHLIMNVSANGAGLVVPTLQDVLAMYEDPRVGNFNLNDPSTDQGICLLDGMKYAQQKGMAGQKADLFGDIHIADVETQKYGIQIAGGLYLGVQLPQKAIDSFEAGGREWSDLSQPPNPRNGHCVVGVDFTADGILLSTWSSDTVPGKDDVVLATWPWMAKYADEIHAIIMWDWLNQQGISPGGFDRPGLEGWIRDVTA